MMKIGLINRYIAKIFLTKFLQIFGGFSLIIFFINLLEAMDKIKASEASFHVAIVMAFLRIPEFINDIMPSLILMSAIITFFLLSSRSEVTIIRSSGFFLWQVTSPIIVAAFALGVFWITIFEPLSIAMDSKFNKMERIYVQRDSREAIEVTNGIWLKQDNLEKPGEEIVIRTQKVYRENSELNYVNFWFFDGQGRYYKRIDAKKVLIQPHQWLLQGVTVNDLETVNQRLTKETEITIPTNLDADFVLNKIVNNFQNPKSFSVFALPRLIEDLKSSGLQSRKFEVQFQALLSKPLLFVAMVLIACYFGLNHIRSYNAVMMVFCGIAFGLFLYITSSVMNSFGSSGMISVFASTWIITFICLAGGTLLIYRKERV